MKKNILFIITFATLCLPIFSEKLPTCTDHGPVINADNSTLFAEVIEADNSFVTTYIPQPDMFAKDKAAVLTCMDPRLTPSAFMGFTSGDMYVFRNAGGLATEDALRSLILAYKLLGAREIFVIQHTDCAMQKFTNDVMDDLLKESIVTAKLEHPCEVIVKPVECDWKNVCACLGKKNCKEYGCIDWLAIRVNLYKSVVNAVKTIRNHPLIPSDVPIYGFIFDVMTGELIPVPKAMKVGKAKPLHCKK